MSKQKTVIDLQTRETAEWSRDFPPLPAPLPKDWRKFMVKEKQEES